MNLAERLRQQETAELLTAAPAANLTVASANAEGTSNYFARSDHSHAITSSANPGATASLLSTTAAGCLQLLRLGVGAACGANNQIAMADGGSIGIIGNELLTVNAAGNFTFSGVGSVVVPDGAWIGADAACSWVYDSTNGDVSTLDNVGVGTAVPGALTDIYANINGFDNDAWLQITNPRDTAGSTYAGINFDVRPAAGHGKSWFGVDQTLGNGKCDFIFLLDAVADDNAVALADEVARITNAGDFGIGITPAYRLHAYTATGDYAAKIRNVHGAAAGHGLWVDTRWNTADNYPLRITSNQGAVELVTVTGQGRTGMGGITVPLAQCHIDQSDNAAAIPVLTVDQADVSEGAINFIASARGAIAGATNSLESVRVELGGVVYRLALYVDA